MLYWHHNFAVNYTISCACLFKLAKIFKKIASPRCFCPGLHFYLPHLAPCMLYWHHNLTVPAFVNYTLGPWQLVSSFTTPCTVYNACKAWYNALTSLRFLGPINWNFWSKMCLPSPQTSTTTEDQQCDQIYTICIKAPTYWDTRKRWLGWEEGGEGDLVIRPEARHYGHWSALAAWARY